MIQASLNKKWQKFAAYLYYFKLLLYICFLTFLTGYILVTAPLREPYRAKDCTIVQQDADLQMTIFVLLGKYFVIILALLHILFEVWHTHQYNIFNLENNQKQCDSMVMFIWNNTRRSLNVNTTFFECYGRQMDVKLTLCANKLYFFGDLCQLQNRCLVYFFNWSLKSNGHMLSPSLSLSYLWKSISNKKICVKYIVISIIFFNRYFKCLDN